MYIMGEAGAAGSRQPSVGRSIASAFTWAAIGCLSAATCYEALIAFGALSVGPQPGQTPPGDNVVVGAALMTLCVGGLVLLTGSLTRHPTRLVPRRLVALVSLAAMSFVVARWFSYDPYYAPTLRRMSDGGIVPGWWIVLLVVLATAAARNISRSPRAGMVLTATIMWLSAATALMSGLGH
ncbi:MAG: hypothetical protein QOJ13_695 [Gaiellales bacterium]|jgi:hypothetical protein|nr:hypothetical protein [Gaiellales bacterium]